MALPSFDLPESDIDVTETAISTNPITLQRETAKRRTFAIISHPDAGKTTLTEKLLLYGGAVQLAGSGHRAAKPAAGGV